MVLNEVANLHLGRIENDVFVVLNRVNPGAVLFVGMLVVRVGFQIPQLVSIDIILVQFVFKNRRCFNRQRTCYTKSLWRQHPRMLVVRAASAVDLDRIIGHKARLQTFLRVLLRVDGLADFAEGNFAQHDDLWRLTHVNSESLVAGVGVTLGEHVSEVDRLAECVTCLLDILRSHHETLCKDA